MCPPVVPDFLVFFLGTNYILNFRLHPCCCCCSLAHQHSNITSVLAQVRRQCGGLIIWETSGVLRMQQASAVLIYCFLFFFTTNIRVGMVREPALHHGVHTNAGTDTVVADGDSRYTAANFSISATNQKYISGMLANFLPYKFLSVISNTINLFVLVKPQWEQLHTRWS